MRRRTVTSSVIIAAVSAVSAASVYVAGPAAATTTTTSRVHLLASGLDGALGSTIGPDGALYVVEGVAGKITRINRHTGARRTIVDALPKRVAEIGGAMDVAFLGHTPYVLVTLVSPDVGGTSVDGIYRVDGRHHVTVIADIGAFSLAHPPTTPFFIPTGVQFAMQPYRHGFLVTDGHHNRVLRVRLDGRISQVATYGDVVPTGLEKRGHTVYVAQAGPVPHLPQNGRILRLRAPAGHSPVASGAPLLVDVEAGCGGLFALSQGTFTPGHPEGSPADPNTGAIVRVRGHMLVPVLSGLDRPTSLEIVGRTGYVVTLTGEVLRIGHLG
jgi:hypothetical protein